MSRIAGIFHRDDRPAGEPQIARMLSVISHTGVDKTSCMHQGPASIGFHLLQTTPESVYESIAYERYPRYWIAADARLDERSELAGRLGMDKRAAGMASDGGLILAAYQRWQEECPKYLLGDFSFAIYDREERKWFCARDQMGVKPFNYYLSENLFVFASESRAILTVPSVPASLDEEHIADLLVAAWDYEHESTYLKHIRRLPPAYSLQVDPQKSRVGEYWNLSNIPEQAAMSDAAYGEKFRALFTESVRCRLRSKAPVSTMMSGGLDSSSITCVAQELAKSRGLPDVQAYSGISDPDWKCRELPYVRILAKHLKIQSRLIPADEMAGDAGNMLDMLLSFDDPHGAGMLDQRMLSYRLAAAAGSNVMLDGLGGDDIFSFPEPAVATLSESGNLWRGLGLSLMMWQSWGGFNREGFGSAWDSFSPPARRFLVPDWARRIKRIFSPPPAPALGFRNYLIDPGFRERTGVSDRIYQRFYKHRTIPGSVKALAIRIATDPHLTGAQEMYDNVAAQFGVEPRRPCLDRRLVEFCIGLPVRQKVRRGWSKWILRSSLEKTVPDAVRWRRNIGGILWRPKYLAMRSNPELLGKMIKDLPKLTADFVDNDAWSSIVRSWFETHQNSNINDIIVVLALETFIGSLDSFTYVQENLRNEERT